ncbi:MAG: hypothetical protein K1X64_08315 [Myxococcaceae bacterium]|nr:hypothetical protein [Myxococcaceae bacterium]
MPFIKEIKTSGVTLRFGYVQLPNPVVSPLAATDKECVIRSVSVVNPVDGGVLTPAVAEYAYVLDGGVETAGRLASVTLAERTETYTYSDAGFAYAIGGTAVSSHEYSSGRVTTDTSEEGTLGFSWSTTSCPSGQECCGETPVKVTETVATAHIGDGGTSSSGFTKEFLVLWNQGQTMQARTLQQTDDCTAGGSCSEGTIQNAWACTDAGVPGYERARKNKRDNWEQYTWAAVDAGALYLSLEKRGVARGASSLTGTDSLESEAYAYVMGSNGERLLSTTTRASIMSSGSNAVTKNWYDANNRLSKVTKSGYTADFYQSTVPKVAATFYADTRSCGGSSSADALGRTLEVRGPCFVSADTATACPSAHPVTTYEYYSNTASGFNRNQLYKVRRYVNGSDDCAAGTPLTTTYANYDASGKPGTVTDENGNDTTYTYDSAGQVLTKTIGGLTTRYAYENGKLARAMYPEGNGEVYCYRTSSNSDCTSGNYTKLLQWKAKKACSGTSNFTCTGNFSERIDYKYNADGTYGGETASYWNGSATVVRTSTAVYTDAHKRATLKVTGEGANAVKAPTFYDRADNVSGVANAFNEAPAFCGGPSGSNPDEPLSALCARLKYDRAERLASMTQYPTGTSGTSQTTCFGHDRNGNVTAVHSGCTATGCSTDGGVSGICDAQGPSKAAQYQYDDFGNVVFAELPWTNNGSGGKGRWLYLYDALGNVTTRRSPDQISRGTSWYTNFAFDKLGRNTSAVAWTGSAGAGMWQLYYDSVSTPSNCPSRANTLGRLARRVDSYCDWLLRSA